MAEPGPALVALGSNLSFGSVAPADVVASAMKDVGALGHGVVTSRLWRSPAWPPGGPEYVNAAMRLETDLPPEALLASLHAIEERWGRERATRWGARTLDLDLLALGGDVRPDAATQAVWRDLSPERQGREAPDQLILPHPRMQDRAFVLAPLAEVASDWRHPLIDRTVQDMLDALPPEALQGMVPLASG